MRCLIQSLSVVGMQGVETGFKNVYGDKAPPTFLEGGKDFGTKASQVEGMTW